MIAVLLIAIALQGQPPARDTRPPVAVAAATIAGTVTSDAAQPVPLRRARVTLVGQGLQTPRTVITRDDGSFTFDRLPAGHFTVSAAKDGFVPMNYGATRAGRPGVSVAVADRQTVRLAVRLPRGAVITGTVTDVDGLPAQGIAVSALAHRFLGVAGERRYLASGVSAGVTDDRGVYRIYGLPAGEYVIAAQSQRRNVGLAGAEVRMMSGGAVSQSRLVMAQVFHPSATEVGRAARLSVRAGEERAGIDVQLQYVPLAAVSGMVATAGGPAPFLTLARTDEAPGFDTVRTARPDAEGRFTFPSVPPGQYGIVARGQTAMPLASSSQRPLSPGSPQMGMAEVLVAGEDVTGVTLSLQPGLTITGQIVFEGETPPAVLPVSLRVPVPATLVVANAGFVAPALQLDGTRFKMEGIMPGRYRIAGTTLQGIRTPIGSWWLRSLVVGGRDILDAPLDLRQSADDAVATFADRASELSGTATDAQGAAVPGVFVLVFTTERSAWFFNSRRVASVRTDREGRYTIRNLPPGEYRAVATTDLEQGEWFDPAVLERLLPTGTPVTIAGIDKKTVDLTVR